jgi:hypothetical protein
MNTDQAKHLSLPDLLARLGHTPVREGKQGRELWYRSPFRQEKDASFHTSFLGGKWIWNDFGDVGGTVIDFVMRHESYTRVKDALDYLERMFPSTDTRRSANPAQASFSFQQQPDRAAVADFFQEARQLEFLNAGPLCNPAILSYLTQERRIPADLAARYLKEVHYRNLVNGKPYFAFGMENQSGGYEIRVASNRYTFKSALVARDVSLIPGSLPGSRTVQVFEGMTDFLSHLALSGTERPQADCLVMHSLSSFQRAADLIRAKEYGRIETFLDNNRAGQEGTNRFCAEFGDLVQPQSHRFAPHVDLNDALKASQPARNRVGL